MFSSRSTLASLSLAPLNGVWLTRLNSCSPYIGAEYFLSSLWSCTVSPEGRSISLTTPGPNMKLSSPISSVRSHISQRMIYLINLITKSYSTMKISITLNRDFKNTGYWNSVDWAILLQSCLKLYLPKDAVSRAAFTIKYCTKYCDSLAESGSIGGAAGL